MGLLKRHPSLTREQFSDYWLHTHAVTAIPWALANGCVYYVQIHNPRLTTAAAETAAADLDIAEWDGAAELVLKPPPGFKESAKAKDFFRRVVVPDEKKFLIDEARKHAKFVDAGTVEGERVVLVENGKIAVGKGGRPVVDITEAMKVWDEWVVEDDEGK
jgi:EthD domain